MNIVINLIKIKKKRLYGNTLNNCMPKSIYVRYNEQISKMIQTIKTGSRRSRSI